MSGQLLPLAVLAHALVAGGVMGPSGAAADDRLLAHGSNDYFWLARGTDSSKQGGSFLTDLYARAAGDARWARVAQVQARVIDVARRGEAQLALLTEGGGWLLLSETTLATGRPLPAGARLLDLAPGGDGLLALALAPSSQPGVDDRLLLFALRPEGWAEVAKVSVANVLPAGHADASLAVSDGAVLVAVRDGPTSVRVYGQSSDGKWLQLADVTVPQTVREFDLLGDGPVPVLWTVEKDGNGRLHWLKRDGVKTVTVGPVAAGGADVVAAAAFAIGKIRVVHGQGLLLSEKSFDALTGASSAGEAEVTLPRAATEPVLLRWGQQVLPFVLLFTIIASMRRREQMRQTMRDVDQLPLAPFGRRLLAGLIDAAPLLAALAHLLYRHRATPEVDLLLTPSVWLPAVAVYLLHTTLVETFTGRSPGKWCCSLRVVALDGGPAQQSALVTRNLLRVVDVLMMLLPLVLVLYSPLRQRAGDVAAGTLVVLNKPRAETEPGEDGEAVVSPESQRERETVEVGE